MQVKPAGAPATRSAGRFRVLLPAPRHGWLLPALLSAGLALWCAFYLLHSYAALAAWMRSLSPDLPHALSWQQEYFSPATWRRGRWLAGIGVPGGLALAACCLCRWRQDRGRRAVWLLSRRDAACLVVLVLVAAAGWCWGQTLLAPGPDEMYSARYCGAAPPLRTAAYYMDPNNHVLFNLLNRCLFVPGSRALSTGRLLSGLAYLLLLPLLYLFAKRYTRHAGAALLIALLLGWQFQVLGFAALARGYLLYLLLQWLAVGAFCRYWEARGKSAGALLGYALAGAGAFWVLPTFLYLFVALSGAALWRQLRRRKADWTFWGYTALSLSFTAVAYWPVLLFSGAGALADNKFVSPQPDLLLGAGKHLKLLLQDGLWLNYPELAWWPLVFFVLPFVGYPLLRGRARTLLLLYAFLWPLYFGTALLLRHFAFLRSLLFQESFALFLLLLLLHRAGRWLATRPLFRRQPRLRPLAGGLFVLPAAALAVHFLFFFGRNADSALYGLSTRWHNSEVTDRIRRFPPGTRIAAPDFAVAWQYLGERAGYSVSVRAAGLPGPEAVLVTHYTDEPGPIQVPGYARVREFLFYRLYLRLPVDSNLLKVVNGF